MSGALLEQVRYWKNQYLIQAAEATKAERLAARLSDALQDISEYEPVGGDEWLTAVALLQRTARVALEREAQP